MVHELAKAKVTQSRIAETLGMVERTVRRILDEDPPQEVDDRSLRKSRGVGRPSTVEEHSAEVRKWYDEPRSPDEKQLTGTEVLRRLRDLGYRGNRRLGRRYQIGIG